MVGVVITSPTNHLFRYIFRYTFIFIYLCTLSHLMSYDNISTYLDLRGPLNIFPNLKLFFILKKVCNNILGLFFCQSILIVYQPCISICIGVSVTTITNYIRRYTYMRFYYDMLLFSHYLQFDRCLCNK